jgi:hypothetical protein
MSAEYDRKYDEAHRHPCPDCGKLVWRLSERCHRCANRGRNRGPQNGHWCGGHRRACRGYIEVWSPTHPHANNKGYVREHRLVMEAHLGRTLLPSEVVHHINGQLDDNRIENLALFASNSEHRAFHNRARIATRRSA